jgi:hypothetical protein
MSVNCVNATIELANEYEVPLILIASRRQIDSEEFGGGYVNSWTTEDFARYVIDNDKKGKVLLARDHGGPWQNTKEVAEKLSLRLAMESAKLSYLADLEAGFQILHIDPSVDIHGSPDVDEVLDRVFELYEYCWSQAQRLGQEVIFEIGTEEQSGTTNTKEQLDYTLNAIVRFCKKNNIVQPSFVVIQTGTRVMETRNVGSFDTPVRVANELPAEIQVPQMIEICNRYAANVAPEFGVAETRALLAVLEENGLVKQADQFLQISYDSNKWNKWMLKDTTANDRDRSIIAGHYVFSHPDCVALKQDAGRELLKIGINLEQHLKEQVKKSILRYMFNFRLVGFK